MKLLFLILCLALSFQVAQGQQVNKVTLVSSSGNCLVKLSYGRRFTVDGITFISIKSKIYGKFPTDFYPSFMFTNLAFSQGKVYQFDRDGPLTYKNYCASNGIQLVANLNSGDCSGTCEYFSPDKAHSYCVKTTDKFYSTELGDSIFVLKFFSKMWLIGDWIPIECRVSKKFGFVGMTLSIEPIWLEPMALRFPRYSRRNDIVLRLKEYK